MTLYINVRPVLASSSLFSFFSVPVDQSKDAYRIARVCVLCLLGLVVVRLGWFEIVLVGVAVRSNGGMSLVRV